jgi:hypothetical protein
MDGARKNCSVRTVAQDVRHGDPCPADSNLHEHHAHLRQGRVSQRRFGISAGPANDSAVDSRDHTDHDY